MTSQPAVVPPVWAARYKKEAHPQHRRWIKSHTAPVTRSNAGVGGAGTSRRQIPAKIWGNNCETVVTVSAAVEDGLEEQWRIVYDPDGAEKDRERGGLVLRDGSVNPGHFCFNPIPTYPLSPLSKIAPLRGSGAVRLGDCGEVSAGWDHTKVIGPDPTTHKHAKNVYAHFHVHADNADLLSHRCGGQTVATAVAATSTKEAAGFSSSSARGAGAALRPASAPSMGDIAAWLCYHRNQPRAFILTRDACWLLFKWKMPGHAKGGIECPSHATDALFDQCTRRRFESINSASGMLLRELPQHGFAIYVRNLADRQPNSNGMYRLWAPST
eukprot:gene3553-11042_t